MIDKLPYLSDDHHYALAAVATRSSQLEHMIELGVSGAMIGRSKLAEYILKNLGADRIVGALEAALLDRLPQNKTEVEDLMRRIRAVRAERNDMLHWIYGIADDPTVAKLATIRPFREKREKHLTADQFMAVADEMLAVVGEIIRMLELCHQQDEAERRPVPGVPPPRLSPTPKGLAGMFAPPHLPSSPPDSANNE
jgi:hypothetical protein